MKKWILAVVCLVVVVVGVGAVGSMGWARNPGAGYDAPDLGPLAAGEVHWGQGRYVEYSVGALPLILSSPHDGALRPAEIPDRARGYPVGDVGTQTLTRLVGEALAELTGRTPHVVISLLARAKLDPNREPEEAAEGHPIARRAWLDYHGFIDAAKEEVSRSWGAGLYLDIHGHGHRTPWIELGYVVANDELNRSDEALDRRWINRRNGLRSLVAATSTPLSELLRGPDSLGALLERRGYRAVPSPGDPGPGKASYFSGGYSSFRHGSFHGGPISAIQIEHPVPGVCDTAENRRDYARDLAAALVVFMRTHYGFELAAASTS